MASGSVELQRPQDQVASTQVPRQPTSSTLVSGFQPKSQVSNSDKSTGPRLNNSKNTQNSVPSRPQAVKPSAVAIGAVTQNNAGKVPMRKPPSIPPTSGKLPSSTQEGSGKHTSSSPSSTTIASPSRKNGGRGKKVLHTLYLDCSDFLTLYSMNRLRA